MRIPEIIVMVGAPVLVSRKKKFPAPELIATEVMVPSKKPDELVSKERVGEFEERLAFPEKLGTRFPKVSWITKFNAEEGWPAVTVCGTEVIIIWVAAAGSIFSICVAEFKIPELIMTLGEPTMVSLKKKLPVPPAIATEVMVPSNAPVLLESKNKDTELEERSAVPTNPLTKLLN